VALQVVDMGLRGRVALVTGATSGVGRAAAKLFASEGAWIAANYRADLHGAKSLVDEIRAAGGRALLAPGDVRSPEGAWMVARYVEHEWAQIDVLLHAGSLLGPDEAVPDPAPLLAELVPAMRERHWGRVVLFGAPGTAATYEALCREGDLRDITTNTIPLPTLDLSESQLESLARAALYFTPARNSGPSGEPEIC
jgi:NAD(P)-dependent dehydrogenase (short-subunit alcohol dehydrogenase family)